jgi:hypothetical protein
VTPNRGIAELNLAVLQARLGPAGSHLVDESGYLEALAGATLSAEARPSMETAMHALLPRRWVVHLHSLAAILMADDAGRADVIPFVSPGLELAQAVAPHSTQQVILLANHGVILQDDELPTRPGGSLERWAEEELKYCREQGLERLLQLMRSPSRSSLRVHSEALGPTPLRLYFPDAAVFADRMLKYLDAEPTKPDWFRLRKQGWTDSPDSSELWLAIQLLYHCRSGLPALDRREAASISGMRMEAYRRKVG